MSLIVNEFGELVDPLLSSRYDPTDQQIEALIEADMAAAEKAWALASEANRFAFNNVMPPAWYAYASPLPF